MFVCYLYVSRIIVVRGTLTKSFEGAISNCNVAKYLEHVILITGFRFTRRGDVQIKLTSPGGTTSEMLARRYKDMSSRAFVWQFTSVHFWGEKSIGTWKLNYTFYGE